jgi:Flp pilus assembly protein TadD
MKRILIVPIVALSLLPISAMADDLGATSTATPAPSISAKPSSAATTSKPSASASTAKSPIVVTSPKSVTEALINPRNLIDAKNFSGALAALKVIDKAFPNNADVNNLLGYSSRNLNQYTQAAIYYSKALKIDPKHVGALEYQGVLFLKTKKLASAKANLAKLKSICGVTCEEYKDLLKEIGAQ